MLLPETILQGRYRIIRQLGQGGMGAVYEAVDERLDTVVALKETLFTEERLRKQFEREARLLARLHHQALPRVSDHFNESEGQFLVMQYIPGEDLFEMQSKKNGPFPPEEVLLWADQLCDALDYLHTQDPQIIHRDIKPQNLKLTARGQAVLLDFGLAKGSAGQMSVATSASIFGYTPNYAPLEQVQGLGTDPRSDIYALAATLYHLLTNVKPPDALSRAGAIVNGQSDPLIPANQVNPQVSSAIAAVLAIGMSQKRDDRYASAVAMREALRLAATQQPGDAATILTANAAGLADANTVLLEQGTKVAGAHTTPVPSEAHTLLADEATNVRAARTGSTETATVVRPPATANRAKVWLGAALVLIVLAGGAGGFYIYRARKQAQANAAAPTQAPAQSTESNQAEKGTAADSVQADPGKTSESDKPKVDATSRAATSKQGAQKKAEVTQPEPTQPTVPTVGSHDRDRNPDRPNTPPPNPNNDPLRNPQGPGHPPGRDQLPNVRTFPNGGRIVTQPDGTRILTMPNGTTRVIPSGRPNPRPNQRRRNP